MQKKHIILIAFGNLGIGGVQTKIRDISRYLLTHNKNTQIHILLRDVSPFNIEASVRGARIYIHHRPSLRLGPFHIPFSLYLLAQILIIRPNVILTFYDVLSALSIFIRILIVKNKPRVILNEDTYSSHHVSDPFKRWLIRLTYPFADIVIVPTLAAKDDLMLHFHVPDKKIVVIPNWTLRTQKLQHSKGRPNLLYVGRFEKQKNILFLLHAFTKIRALNQEVTLTLLGEGSETKKIAHYVRAHSLEKSVSIHASTQDITTYLRGASAVVMTSFYEGMSIAILEAMAAGRAVVATYHPGADEYIKNNKTGFVARNEKEFIAYILKLLRNSRQRSRVSINAHRYVLAYFSSSPLAAYAKLLVPRPKTI